MSDHSFAHAGRSYHITAPFDADAALSAAKRLRVLAAYLDEGAPFADDPTTPEDGWLLSDVLSRVERSNDDGAVYPMARGERLHPELERAPMRVAVSLFEQAARHVACAQLALYPLTILGMHNVRSEHHQRIFGRAWRQARRSRHTEV